MHDTSSWEHWLQDWVRDQTGKHDATIPATSTWADLGLRSRDLIALNTAVEEASGQTLEATAAWNYPTIRQLAQRLAGEQPFTQPGDTPPQDDNEPMAIVGIACRFPGAKNGLVEFWDMLYTGSDAISEVPDSRWSALGFVPSHLRQEGVPRYAGLIDDPFGFDAQYFAISPTEAARMDPQQQMLLEVASDALQDAGLLPCQIARRAVGVFVGVSGHEHILTAAADLAEVDAWTNSGASVAMLANRLSYNFDLSGPSIAIDTACSSSLVALHVAATSIRAGECDMAFVAGVNFLLSPAGGLSFSHAGAMADDGRCKVFDHRADGYVRSEGCGVLVVKRLNTALRDGSRIRGIVKGSAVNTNGRSNGLLAPRTSAQSAVLRQALANSGVNADEISYVECHGTGTALGDPIEIEALGDAYGRRRIGTPLLVGSVKSNIGHLEGAAGMAGVIKVLLAMSEETLPPSIHFEAPNPMIDFSGFEVVTGLRPWPDGSRPRRAGVSSFGFGGSNSHVVLEQPPPYGSDVDPAWVFSGQTSRWAGMGQNLLAEPGFAQMVHRIDPVIHKYSGFSIRELIAEGRLPSGPMQVQPALFTIQVALASLWLERGYRPAFVIGHSMGEVAAACIAGILSPEDSARLICRRAECLQRFSGKGAMVISSASAQRTGEIIDGLDDVWVAGHNSPTMTLISGKPGAVKAAVDRLGSEAAEPRYLDVDFASHCPLMDEVLDPFREAVETLEVLPGEIPLISTVSGSHPSEGVSHWIKNLRQPVFFTEAVKEVLNLGVRAFVEVSPHPALLTAIAETASGEDITVRPGLVRDVQEDLPSRRRWNRDTNHDQHRRRKPVSSAPICGKNHMLGSMLSLPGTADLRLWRSTSMPQKESHRLGNRPVVPAWKLLSTLLIAGYGHVKEVLFHSPLSLEKVQEVLTTTNSGEVTIHVAEPGASDATLVASAQTSEKPLMAPPNTTGWEPNEWEEPTDEVLAALAGPGCPTGWFHDETRVALRIKLPESRNSRLAALLDAACLLPSLAAGTTMTPVGVGAVAELGTSTADEAIVTGHFEDGVWQVIAKDRADTPLLLLTDLSAHDLGSSPDAMQAKVMWRKTTLNCTGATVWAVPAPGRADPNPVAAATKLVLEARRRLDALKPGERLAIATSGLWNTTAASPEACALWGLASPIAAEYPDRWLGIIDSPTSTSTGELCGWSLELGSFSPVPHPRSFDLDTEDAVLVTGAFGGIGRLLVRFLADHGARVMVLVTRSRPDPLLMDELSQQGVTVWIATVDLVEHGALSDWLRQWQLDTGRRIGLVYHLAGYSPDVALTDLSTAELGRTLAIKAGALTELLDVCDEGTCGIVFSSAASIRGVQGQSAYAAANALVDGIVRRAVASGHNWRVVNWGPWASVGMAGDGRAKLASEALRSQGWNELRPEAALRASIWAFSQQSPQAFIVGGRANRTGNTSDEWERADEAERHRLVGSIVRHHLGITDKLSYDRPLAEYGMDSILALRILRSLNELVGADLPVGFLWNHPTINTIIAAHELGPVTDTVNAPPIPDPDHAHETSAFEQLLEEVEDR